jgi:hypothetical protein
MRICECTEKYEKQLEKNLFKNYNTEFLLMMLLLVVLTKGPNGWTADVLATLKILF